MSCSYEYHEQILFSRRPYRGKLGNGEHLSLEVYKYKENNIYVLTIMQHKEEVKFYLET